MKYGYTCQCGWRLNRGNLTRKEYADKKTMHAVECKILAKELQESGQTPKR